jgi:hypothetical protein
MSFGWQNLVVLVIVGLAIAFVVRKLWNAILSSKSSSSCGACGSCSAPKQEVVTIDVIKRS